MGQECETLVLPVDRHGFLRRECPGCKRHFKVRYAALDAQSVHRALARQVVHLNEVELGAAPAERHCPYCGAGFADDEWFTEEQRGFLEKRAEYYRREVQHAQLKLPRQTLGSNPYLTFLPVRPEPFSAPLKPEAPDMRRFPLFCCREELKVSESWVGAVHCFFCGALHQSTRVAPGFMERMGLA